MDGYRYLVCLALNLNQRYSGFGIPGANSLSQLYIFIQEFRVVLISIPFGLPVAYDANPKSSWVNLSSH